MTSHCKKNGTNCSDAHSGEPVMSQESKGNINSLWTASDMEQVG